VINQYENWLGRETVNHRMLQELSIIPWVDILEEQGMDLVME
jgi:hypothetical protein